MLVVFARMTLAMAPFPTREACEAAGRDFVSTLAMRGQSATYTCKPIAVSAGTMTST